MMRAEMALDTEWLDALQQLHQTVPEAIDRFARRDLRPFASQRIDQTLRQEPPVRQWPSDYPLEWTSEKQRRYVMAYVLERDAAGNIIPYRRTHTYIHGWHVRADYTNGLTSIVIFHDSEVADFVSGRRQQQFHRITGWDNAADVFQVLSLDLSERIALGLPGVMQEVLHAA